MTVRVVVYNDDVRDAHDAAAIVVVVAAFEIQAWLRLRLLVVAAVVDTVVFVGVLWL